MLRDVEELRLGFDTEAMISRPVLGVLHTVLAESDTSVAVFRPREGTFNTVSELSGDRYLGPVVRP